LGSRTIREKDYEDEKMADCSRRRSRHSSEPRGTDSGHGADANRKFVIRLRLQQGKTCVSLGADLTSQQRATVLSLLGITEEDLSKDTVITVTNAEEHEAFDSYIDKSITGTRALSCALLTEKGDGNGIQVTTKNITYCTTEMYQNALATAGVKNADVVVAGPVQLSGTAALLGVTKAYSKMSGTSLKAENVDAAAQELVVTSDLGKETGDTAKSAELIATVKDQVADGNLSDDDIMKAIDKASDELGLNLTDEQKQRILELMKKLDTLNLDTSTLKEQAGQVYDALKEKGIDLGVSKDQAMNIFEKIANWFLNLWKKLRGVG
jgi:uncharacterized protein YpuA (DUF1002 family)